MAHLAMTIDPDPIRRRRFMARASASLKSLPGLETAQVEAGELAIDKVPAGFPNHRQLKR
jgi:hypothetical protein